MILLQEKFRYACIPAVLRCAHLAQGAARMSAARMRVAKEQALRIFNALDNDDEHVWVNRLHCFNMFAKPVVLTTVALGKAAKSREEWIAAA